MRAFALEATEKFESWSGDSAGGLIRGSADVGVVPEFWWGERLWTVRRRFGRTDRMISQQALAQHVSALERCTRRDIAAVERSRARPTDPRLHRIAMGMAVALGVDPIYCRYQLDLVRWQCDLELDDLRPLNPDWVELVERMNGQLSARPPRWANEGSR